MVLSIPKPKKINYINNPKNLGDKIKNKRLELELTQEKAAAIIGVTRQGLCDWENIVTEPAIEFYPRIITFLSYVPFNFETETVSGRLKKYRYINGLSQEALSTRIGIGSATIHRIEQRKGKINKKTNEALKKIITIE
jgi:DNA-binding XRE family transcriptional regulator